MREIRHRRVQDARHALRAQQPLAHTAYVDARAHCHFLDWFAHYSDRRLVRVDGACGGGDGGACGAERAFEHLALARRVLVGVHQLQLIRLACLDVSDRESESVVRGARAAAADSGAGGSKTAAPAGMAPATVAAIAAAAAAIAAAAAANAAAAIAAVAAAAAIAEWLQVD